MIGIDLGTTRSVVAHVDVYGKPYVIPNREGDFTTPSAVLFEDGSVTVGKEALKAQAAMPDNVATFAKREMGSREYSRKIGGQTYAPELIQSCILGRLRKDAETKLGQTVQKAVITVPAHFNEPKRRSTIDAAQLAGLEVLAIINEPTAAAIAFGVQTHANLLGTQTVLVYDLGGGTFDISLVRVEGSKIEVLGTDGNAMLGGIDWDKCLVAWLDDQFAANCGFRPSESAVGQAMLMEEAQDLKHTLSSRIKTRVRIAFNGQTLQAEISREEFDEMTAHLLDRTRFTIRQLLTDRNMKWSDIDQVILVGGSSRMPQVSEMLSRDSGLEPNLTVSADEAIAHGAALYAQTMITSKNAQQESSKLSITDVTSHNLCVLGVDNTTGLKRNHVMIQRNSPIPAKQVARFETAAENQTSVVVNVVEGGDIRGRNGTVIGRCVLRNLPPGLPAGTAVDVSFRYDPFGLVHVKAKLPKTGQATEIKISRAFGQSASDLDLLSDIHAALGIED